MTSAALIITAALVVAAFIGLLLRLPAGYPAISRKRGGDAGTAALAVPVCCGATTACGDSGGAACGGDGGACC